jgi:hypothetical protein
MAGMTKGDLDYLMFILDRGLLESPCIELGGGFAEHSAKGLLRSRGIDCATTDLHGDVDYLVNFESDDASTAIDRRFASALVLNVLEHTFDPIRILDNVMKILRPRGSCVVVAPSVWPIHSYPIYCWRVLPDFYREYAKRRGLEIIEDTLLYAGTGASPTNSLPLPGRSSSHRLYSRIVHRAFNTYGRGMVSPSHVAIAAVFRNRAADAPRA